MKAAFCGISTAASIRTNFTTGISLAIFALTLAVFASAQNPHMTGLIGPTVFGPSRATQAGQQQTALTPKVNSSTTPAALTFTFGTMDFPGAHASSAYNINDKGQVVGLYGDCLIAGGTCSNLLHAGHYGFRMSGSSFKKISFPGATLTAPVGINKSGAIVGAYELSDNSLHGFLLVGTTYTTLDYPAAVFSYPLAINNSGTIVGDWYDGSIFHGYVYSSGVFTSIDWPGALNYTEAADINQAGDIVGTYRDGAGTYHGYLLHSGAFTTIDYPGAASSSVYGINDKGQMVGAWGIGFVQRFDQQHGFLYDGSTFTSFDAPFGGVVVTWARSINNKSQVVGFYEDNTLSDFGFVASFK